MDIRELPTIRTVSKRSIPPKKSSLPRFGEATTRHRTQLTVPFHEPNSAVVASLPPWPPGPSPCHLHVSKTEAPARSGQLPPQVSRIYRNTPDTPTQSNHDGPNPTRPDPTQSGTPRLRRVSVLPGSIVGQSPHSSRRVPKRAPPSSTSLSACLTPSLHVHHASAHHAILLPFPDPTRQEPTLTDRGPHQNRGPRELRLLP